MKKNKRRQWTADDVDTLAGLNERLRVVDLAIGGSIK